MAILTFLVFLKLFHVSLMIGALCSAVQMAEVIEVNKALNRGSPTLGMGYAKFKKEKFSYLNITSLGSDLVESESHCGLACLQTSSCFSYNMAVFPDINGKRFCELLPSDKYNNSETLVTSKDHHHFSIASQCSSWPCKNNGKCVSLYQKNSYVCVCKEGFTGENCETNVNECESNPCLNRGSCVDMTNAFSCSCPPGFVGDLCETESSGGYGSTSEAFIFSLSNSKGLPPLKSMVQDPEKAINKYPGSGPTFGLGHDIHIADKANSNSLSLARFDSSYPLPSGVDPDYRHTILAGTTTFTPADWEVFYLV